MKKYGKIILIVVGIIVVVALIFLIYFKTTIMSKNEIKNIVANYMNANSNDLYFDSIDLYFDSIDFEMDKNIYEVEVYYQNKDYEYKINAKNGKVIYTDFRNDTNQNNSSNGNKFNNNSNNGNANQNNLNQQTANISEEEAKDIALTHANLAANSVSFLRTELDHDHRTLVYEVDFIYDNYEYDYMIDAMSGEIISYDKDYHD